MAFTHSYPWHRRAACGLFVAALMLALDTAAVEEGTVRFAGEITPASVAAFIARYREARPARLVITSAGGDVVAGIRLGRWVHDRRLDITVRDYCLSSCANYVFTAAARKTIAPGAVVAWHGNYLLLQQTGAWRAEIPLRMKKYGETRMVARDFVRAQVSRLAALEKAFFRDIGVDPAICYIGKLPPHSVPNYFMLSPADMARFGVSEVQAPPAWPPMRRQLRGEDLRRIALDPPN